MLDKELASGAEELALLVDAVQDYAIVLLGMDGEIRTWNRGAQRTFGYSSDEAIGRESIYTREDEWR